MTPRWTALHATLRAALVTAVLALVSGCQPDTPHASLQASPVAPAQATPARIEQGRQLAVIGNCAACHTARGGMAYAGGEALDTPFGQVFAGNLTPDDDTGLGRWTAGDFWNALHRGRSRDGRALVPAFPYTSYTHVTRDDSDALYAYLRSLAPIRQASPPHALRFPYGTPLALAAWQWLFFEPADLATETIARAALSPSQARGAYLVQGLGHCAGCHAPRNAFGAPAARATGAAMPMQDWYAPSLHPEAGQAMETDEVVALLKGGQTRRATVLGPMADVVYQSTQHWTEADRRAVADHLATLPVTPAASPAAPAPADVMAAGQRLYADNCADCHGVQGEGVRGAYPALAGNASVRQPDPRNLVKLMRHGGFAPATSAWPRPYSMPPQTLSDAETAAVLSYIRQSWGHQASALTSLQVFKLR